MMLVPHILNYTCGFTAGQFPKFKEDVYWLETPADQAESGSQFILPTAETALVNLHRDEILDAAELPKKYFAFTPCYRKEVGSYRSEERGMIRFGFGEGFGDTFYSSIGLFYRTVLSPERRDGSARLPTFDDGAENAAVCAAILESDRRGSEWVTIRGAGRS